MASEAAQCDLFDPPPVRFDGETYDPAKDAQRLGRQLAAVRELMRDGRWRSLREIAMAVGAPEASVSARLRDMRKPRFGAWEVDRRRRDGAGLWEYAATEGE